MIDTNYRNILLPADMCWRLLNNLSQFNDKPDVVLNIYNKIQKLREYKVFGMFYEPLNLACDKYYSTHEVFPDIHWIIANYKTNDILVTDEPITNEILLDLDKKLSEAILKQMMDNTVNNKELVYDDWVRLTREMVKYTSVQKDIPLPTKEDILNLQDNYQTNIKGIRTGMESLDEAIGLLGYKSLSVLAGVSGSGKSTWAVSLAYNVVVHQGLCVDYITFEVPKEHMWQNLASCHGNNIGFSVSASTYKDGLATEEQKEIYKKSISDLFQKLDKSGGRIDILDQTTTQCATFEELIARLEAMAEQRKRKADLIIIDNVDNLQILKSFDKDESTRVNNYIIRLDAFSKTYCDGEGTAILLLTQVNRTGIKKMSEDTSENKSRSKIQLDVTCIQKFNALYEKATCVLALYADAAMRAGGFAKIFPLKLRNHPIPLEPIQLRADYVHSCIGGSILSMPDKETATRELDEIEQNFIDDNDDIDFDFDL